MNQHHLFLFFLYQQMILFQLNPHMCYPTYQSGHLQYLYLIKAEGLQGSTNLQECFLELNLFDIGVFH